VPLSTALRDGGYWTICGCVVASASIITAAHFHKQPLLAEAAGLGQAGAAATLVTYAGASLAATLGGGWLVDRSPRAPFLAGSVLLAAASVLLLAAETALVCHASFAVYGIAYGLIGVASGPSLARRFGREHYGAIRGSMSTLAVGGASIGPLVLGISEDVAHSFRPGLWVFTAVMLPLLLASGLADLGRREEAHLA